MAERSVAYPAIRVHTFGAFTIERLVLPLPLAEQKPVYEEVPHEEWRRRMQSRTLLKLLLCRPQRRARRGLLLQAFWPDTHPENADQYLNAIASILRQVLRPVPRGESLLSTKTDPPSYELADQHYLWVDADAFEALLNRADRAGARADGEDPLPLLEKAYSLTARGVFLEEEDGEWARERQQWLDGARHRCLHALASLYETRGMTGQAEHLFAKLLSRDPTDEDALYRVMVLLAGQGRHLEALTLYQRTADLLREEDEVEPTVQIQALAHQLRSGSTSLESARTEIAKEKAKASEEALPLLLASPGTLMRASGDEVLFFSSPLLAQSLPAEMTAVERAIRIGMQLEKIIMLVTQRKGRAMSWSEHQSMIDRIDQEIDMFDALKPQQISEEYTISRRQAIIAVATLPFALLPAFWQGQRHVVVMEELLSRCAASISACWHLMKGNDFAVVGQVLSAYLPALKKMAQEPSSYQQTAASLALQGYTLEGLLAHHRNQLSVRVAYDGQALRYSRLTEDHTQLVAALYQLAGGFTQSQRPMDALQALQEALLHLDKVPPALQSGVYGRLAQAHAQCKQEQEALRYQSLAREAFFKPPSDTDNSSSFNTVYGIAHLYHLEGWAFLDLARHYPEADYSQKAWNAFAEVEKLPATVIIPERIRIEVINHLALTALALGNLEQFCDLLEQGANGAKMLGSQKRRQEAIDAYWKGRGQWPNEPRVRDLADLFVN
jgi:DNA-binding SARP family transcriptional activator